MKLSIITRCTRIDNLLEIEKSVYDDKFDHDIEWHILFDTSVLRDLPAKLVEQLSVNPYTFLHYIEGKDGDLLYPQSMEVVNKIKDRWIYYLDDDNIMHPNYYEEFKKKENINENQYKVIVGNQYVNFKDFTGLEYRYAKAENCKYQHIDLAQITWHSSLFETYSFVGDYAADGMLVETIHKEHPEYFIFLNIELCYYNYLVKKSKGFVPRIMYIGPGKPELRSDQFTDFEDDSLNILYLEIFL